ncbi:MAG: IS200/IS605 family transposase [Phycisphaerales bacterium]|nr:IS200/IS605 family transposase [Phycisphaerales bacterium]
MPSTWSQILLHIVFSTKQRQPLISPELEERLHPYMGGIIRSLGGSRYTIGGMPDHVHMLVRWTTKDSIASLVGRVKSQSTMWVHETFPDLPTFKWQEGYGVFSVSPSNKEQVERYILNQKEHHRRQDFKTEFVAMLDAHGIEFEPRYLWD